MEKVVFRPARAALERRNGVKAAIDLVRRGLAGWKEDNGTRMAAALAYTSLFAVAPMLLLSASAAEQVYGEPEARVELFNASNRILGASSAKALVDILAASQAGSGATNILFGTILLVIAASGAFAQLAAALNEILRSDARPPSGLLATVRGRLIGVVIVLALGLLTVVLTLLAAWLAFAARTSAEYLPSNVPLLLLADTLLTFVAVGFAFAMLYRFVPHQKTVQWPSAMGGAMIGSALFALAKILL
ncbi:MAG: YihY/virulence factor BrkB family protein, partial [Armatimonadota bacterium]|nr:YihY/virulence factor BrkB family protein [Armatimonadota bacterium]